VVSKQQHVPLTEQWFNVGSQLQDNSNCHFLFFLFCCFSYTTV